MKEKKKVFVDYDEGSHNVSVQLSGIRKADLPQHKRVRVAGERFQKDWSICEVVQRVLGTKHWEDIEGLLNRWVGRFARKNFPVLIRYFSGRCKPDAETFNALINVHGRAGQWRWAMNIKGDMLRAAVCICTLLPYRHRDSSKWCDGGGSGDVLSWRCGGGVVDRCDDQRDVVVGMVWRVRYLGNEGSIVSGVVMLIVVWDHRWRIGGGGSSVVEGGGGCRGGVIMGCRRYRLRGGGTGGVLVVVVVETWWCDGVMEKGLWW
ncbi:hypothetical protein C3L33_02159, partial [Rhododendron williamsianum]